MWGGVTPPKVKYFSFSPFPHPPLKRGGCNVYQLKATWRPPGQSAFHQAFGGETRGDQLFKLFSGLTIGSIHYSQWGCEKCSNSFSNLEDPVVPLNLLLLSRCLFGGLGQESRHQRRTMWMSWRWLRQTLFHHLPLLKFLPQNVERDIRVSADCNLQQTHVIQRAAWRRTPSCCAP